MNGRGLWIPVAAALVAAVWLAPVFVRLPHHRFSVGYSPLELPPSFPASWVVRDDRPVFHIDPDRPWRIVLGRETWMDGRGIVTLDQSGRVIYQNIRDREEDVIDPGWERAEDVLPPDAVAAVLAAVESNRLTELDREYAAAVADGSRWILRIRQGEHEKTVYLSNHFPDAVVRFARQLDEMIATTAGPRLWWRPVAEADHPGPGGELWDSIRR